ncbi:MAG: NGG1p interacting factor NIF3 [Pseudomonadota bacterium]
MYKIVVFIPDTHLEEVKTAMFAVGGGKIGNYDCCSFETSGTGQFRPLEGSDPYLGQQGTVEKVREYRLEMVCADSIIKDVARAMKGAHPYEEVAYDVIKLEDIKF